MKAILNRLINHQKLSREESRQIIINIADGQYNSSQIASFLTVYMMRSISLDELEGFRSALLELCILIDLDEYDTIDLCGTGGDGKDTFNISTLSSFVTAGAGVKVTKLGNYGVSSGCGSSNVLEALGVKFSNKKNFLLDIGGEIITNGSKHGVPWLIGIQDPSSIENQSIFEISSSDFLAIATSGEYRNQKINNNGEIVSHTFVPQTKLSIPDKSYSVTVASEESSMIADAWATALNVLGPEKGIRIANDHKVAVMYIS